MQQASGRRKQMLGSNRGHNDQIQADRIQISDFQSRLSSPQSQCKGRLALPGNVSFSNAGSLEDPLVRGIHHRSQIFICQHSLRHRHSPTDDVSTATETVLVLCQRNLPFPGLEDDGGVVATKPE